MDRVPQHKGPLKFDEFSDTQFQSPQHPQHLQPDHENLNKSKSELPSSDPIIQEDDPHLSNLTPTHQSPTLEPLP